MSDTHQNSGAGGWDYSAITADTPAPSLHPFSYRLIEPIKRNPPFAPLIPRLFWLFGSAPPYFKTPRLIGDRYGVELRRIHRLFYKPPAP